MWIPYIYSLYAFVSYIFPYILSFLIYFPCILSLYAFLIYFPYIRDLFYEFYSFVIAFPFSLVLYIFLLPSFSYTLSLSIVRHYHKAHVRIVCEISPTNGSFPQPRLYSCCSYNSLYNTGKSSYNVGKSVRKNCRQR